jgi:microcompartment protein CcmK/EutM
MQLCRVIKSAVATVKNSRLGDCKILVCQPVDLDGTSPLGPSFLAWDRVVKAGAGELVLVVNEGSSARLVFGDRKIPLTAFVAAVVDALDLSEEKSLTGSSVVERSRAS